MFRILKYRHLYVVGYVTHMQFKNFWHHHHVGPLNIRLRAFHTEFSTCLLCVSNRLKVNKDFPSKHLWRRAKLACDQIRHLRSLDLDLDSLLVRWHVVIRGYCCDLKIDLGAKIRDFWWWSGTDDTALFNILIEDFMQPTIESRNKLEKKFSIYFPHLRSGQLRVDWYRFWQDQYPHWYVISNAKFGVGCLREF